MIFDMPDTPSLATGTPSASQTFGEAVKGAVEENPVGQFGEWYQRAVAANPDAFNYGTPTKVTPLTEEQYKASPHYREGVPYQKGMTETLAEVLAHQYDDKQTQAATADTGSGAASITGSLVGGTLDPLYYIPFVDGINGAIRAGEVALRAHEFETLAKVAAVAGKDYAVGGRFLAGGMKQATNAALSYLAEQPGVDAENRAFGEKYDLDSAATGLLQVALAGGLLGGVAHSLSVPDRIAGVNRAMEQIDRGEPVDVSDVVKPQPVREIAPTGLRSGTIPDVQDGMPEIHKIALGIAKKEQAGIELTPDEHAILDSVKTDGGVSYLRSQVEELSERREDTAYRKKVAEMTPAERSKALLTHELTGIPNRRAWDEGERMPVIASMDADNLKRINDTMGHPKGDEALTKIAKAVQTEATKVGGKGYHISGDEFRAEFPTQEAAQRFHVELSRRLEGATVKAGEKVHKGIGFSYGEAADLDTAEEKLRADKASRKAQGLRTERTPESGGVPAEPAEGNPVHDDDSRLERLQAYRQQLLDLQTGTPSYRPTGVPDIREPENVMPDKPVVPELAKDAIRIRERQKIGGLLTSDEKALLSSLEADGGESYLETQIASMENTIRSNRKAYMRMPESVSTGPMGFKPKALGKEGETLYRETNVDGLHEILFHHGSGDIRENFVTNDKDLAIGQGMNKGVHVEYDASLVAGEKHFKPGTGVIGGEEFKTHYFAPGAAKKITLAKGVEVRNVGDKAWLARYFDESTNKSDETVYTRKPMDVDAPIVNSKIDKMRQQLSELRDKQRTIDESLLPVEDRAMLEKVRETADHLRGMAKALLAGADCYRG